MSIQMSKDLQAKAVVLHSMTIDSPTARVNKDNEPIRPTVYFDNPVKDDAGKLVAGKKSKLYTPDAAEAKALNATQDNCECVNLDGSGRWTEDNPLHFRFLKSSLTDGEVKEIKGIKGMLAANKSIIDMKRTLKRLSGAYVKSMTKEQRHLVANAVAELVNPALEILRTGSNTDEADSPLF